MKQSNIAFYAAFIEKSQQYVYSREANINLEGACYDVQSSISCDYGILLIYILRICDDNKIGDECKTGKATKLSIE